MLIARLQMLFQAGERGIGGYALQYVQNGRHTTRKHIPSKAFTALEKQAPESEVMKKPTPF